MELLDRFLGDEEESSESDDADDMLFDEGEDLDGFGGDDEFDDGLGFEEGDEGDAATAELEGRIDELENEVASLSSTVSTIRSENEEISNTVEDVEENVRKLLDIYEMVTRGVNPFVDDVQGGAGGGFDGGGGSLGLFDDDDDGEDDAELDDDIAGADAEEFFDDDFLDDGADDFDDGGDDFGGMDGEAATTDTASTEDTMGDGDDSDDSGKSFEELKDEYESGDADWAEDEMATNGDGFDEGFDDGDGEVGGEFDDGFDDGDDEFDTGFDDDSPAAAPSPNDSPSAAATADSEAPAAATQAASPDAATGAGDLQFAANTLMESEGAPTTKPYLERLPSGYVGDLLVMEWLEYLVEQGDVEDAARAVEYYRRIQWLGEGAADELQEFLVGFGDGEFDEDEDVTGAPSALSIDHHVASLRYISRLTGSTADSIVFECWSGGGGVPFGL